MILQEFFRRPLSEALSPAQAAAIYLRLGADRGKLWDLQYLKAFRNKVNLASHTDKGGDGKDAAEINAAFDTLKDSGGFRGDPAADNSAGRARKPRPEPQRGGRHDFTNIDYIKAHFEHVCRGAPKRTFTGYDGSFCRYSFTIPCSTDKVHEATQALVIWQTKGANNYRCTAVFMQDSGKLNPIYLVWHNGQNVSYEMPENDSFNNNFSNDQQWMRKLPDWLDKLQ